MKIKADWSFLDILKVKNVSPHNECIVCIHFIFKCLMILFGLHDLLRLTECLICLQLKWMEIQLILCWLDPLPKLCVVSSQLNLFTIYDILRFWKYRWYLWRTAVKVEEAEELQQKLVECKDKSHLFTIFIYNL